MTIKELLAFQRSFDERHGGKSGFFIEISEHNLADLEHLIVCLAGELGELANLTKKVVRGDFGFEEKRAEMSQEVADIFAYLLKLCAQMNIDLEGEYLRKMSVNEVRFRKFEK